MKTIQFGNSDSIEFKGTSYGALSAILKLVHTTDNTSIVHTDVDLTTIFLKLNLVRGNEVHQLFSENLKVLASLDNYKTCVWNVLQENADFSSSGFITVTKGASTKEQMIIPIIITFGGVINLRNDDKLILEVSTTSSTINSTNLNATTSVLELDLLESIGIETVLPQIKTKLIEASQSEVKFTPGDDITELMLLNLDKATITDADQIVNFCTVTSDKFATSDNYRQLLAKRYVQFETATYANDRNQTFMLIPNTGVEHDSVKVDLSLQTGNVTSSKNYFVYRTFKTSQKILALAGLTEQKHMAKTQIKMGITPNVSLSAINQKIKQISK